jgi:hypothetical protein
MNNISIKNTTDSNIGVPEHIKNAWELLGGKVVIIAVNSGTKHPVYKGWNNLSLKDMDDPIELAKIAPEHNLAVLLGEPSGGLCSIDCDSDRAVIEMMKFNKKLGSTLITSASRGGNFWVRIKGPYPSTTPIPGFGEWRSTGVITVFKGRHPSGKDYRVECRARPIEMAFDEIVWPREAMERFREKLAAKEGPPTPTPHSSEQTVTEILETGKLESGKLSTADLNTDGSIELHPDETTSFESGETVPFDSGRPTTYPPAACAPVALTPLASGKPRPSGPSGAEGTSPSRTGSTVPCTTEGPKRITAQQVVKNLSLMKEVESRYLNWQDENKELGQIYIQQIERFHEGELSGRNAMIVQSVPRLYRALDEKVIVTMVMTFYDINQPYFSDPREQHEREARAMIKLVAESYLADLSPEERSVYEGLPNEWRATFRICRDLARTGNEVFGPGHFYMSCEQLRLRLGLKHSAQAERILKRFKKAGLLQAVGTDTRKKLEATTFLWLLQTTDQQEAA